MVANIFIVYHFCCVMFGIFCQRHCCDLFLTFPIFLSVCAHFDVQCFDIYIHGHSCLDFSVCLEFSAMPIKLSELILHIAFARSSLCISEFQA